MQNKKEVGIGSAGRQFRVSKLRIGSYKILINYEKDLEDTVPLLKKGLLQGSKLLKTGNDIVVIASSTDDEFIKSKMSGVTGFTPNAYSMFLRIDCESDWSRFIVGTILHEFNHVIRFQRTNFPRRPSVLDNLVMEGLAQCFEEDATGTLRPWSEAITREKAREIWQNIKDRLELKSRDLNDRIFIREGDEEFPLWAGYTMGYLMVRNKLKKLKKTNWDKLIGMNPKSFLENGL